MNKNTVKNLGLTVLIICFLLSLGYLVSLFPAWILGGIAAIFLFCLIYSIVADVRSGDYYDY